MTAKHSRAMPVSEIAAALKGIRHETTYPG